MAKRRYVGYIRAIMYCPNCNGSTTRLWHIHVSSSSRRETMLCGHCQTSLEVFLCLKVTPSAPADVSFQSERQME